MNEHRPGPEADGRKAASSLRDERVKNAARAIDTIASTVQSVILSAEFQDQTISICRGNWVTNRVLSIP